MSNKSKVKNIIYTLFIVLVGVVYLYFSNLRSSEYKSNEFTPSDFRVMKTNSISNIKITKGEKVLEANKEQLIKTISALGSISEETVIDRKVQTSNTLCVVDITTSEGDILRIKEKKIVGKEYNVSFFDRFSGAWRYYSGYKTDSFCEELTKSL